MVILSVKEYIYKGQEIVVVSEGDEFIMDVRHKRNNMDKTIHGQTFSYVQRSKK